MRLTKSIDEGAAFQLKPPKEATLEDQQEKLAELSEKGEQLLNSLKIEAGDLCLYTKYTSKTVC